MKQKPTWKWLMVLVLITGALYFYKYRFYTPEPRILFFEQIGKSVLVKDNEWIELLKDTYKRNNLKTVVFNNKCFEFWLSNQDKDTVRIELHEYHQQGCSGDPNTSPRINTFIIDKTSKIVSWYDVMRDKTVSFEEYIQLENEKKP